MIQFCVGDIENPKGMEFAAMVGNFGDANFDPAKTYTLKEWLASGYLYLAHVESLGDVEGIRKFSTALYRLCGCVIDNQLTLDQYQWAIEWWVVEAVRYLRPITRDLNEALAYCDQVVEVFDSCGRRFAPARIFANNLSKLQYPQVFSMDNSAFPVQVRIRLQLAQLMLLTGEVLE